LEHNPFRASVWNGFNTILNVDAEVGVEDEKMRKRRRRLKTMEGERELWIIKTKAIKERQVVAKSDR
jgi:hypothetical protein